MKKFINRATSIRRDLAVKFTMALSDVKTKLTAKDGQFVVDHAVVFVLIIVLGGIALALLTTFLQNDMAPTLKTKILEFFN